jgi:hypothetical protein
MGTFMAEDGGIWGGIKHSLIKDKATPIYGLIRVLI